MSLDDIQRLCRDTLVSHLGIEITHADAERVCASMPVDERVRQPFGVLHGGASVALAETLASIGAMLAVDGESRVCMGLEINANHIRAVREGPVHGTATPLHLGGRNQVWNVQIVDREGALVCVSRVTMAVLERRR